MFVCLSVSLSLSFSRTHTYTHTHTLIHSIISFSLSLSFSLFFPIHFLLSFAGPNQNKNYRIESQKKKMELKIISQLGSTTAGFKHIFTARIRQIYWLNLRGRCYWCCNISLNYGNLHSIFTFMIIIIFYQYFWSSCLGSDRDHGQNTYPLTALLQDRIASIWHDY